MIYKFIKIKGKGTEGSNTGYFVPRMYQLTCNKSVLKAFGLPYIKERLAGWTVWYVKNEEDYKNAIKTLDELKKTRIFDYMVADGQK